MKNRVLSIALLALALATLSLDAGGAKKPSTKKDEPAGAIEIYKTDAGKYRFRIKNAEGKTIAMPLPQMHWDTKKETLSAIDDLKEILDTAKPVEVKDETKKDEAKKETKKAG